jgi:hypothetical protein
MKHVGDTKFLVSHTDWYTALQEQTRQIEEPSFAKISENMKFGFLITGRQLLFAKETSKSFEKDSDSNLQTDTANGANAGIKYLGNGLNTEVSRSYSHSNDQSNSNSMSG